MRGGFFTKLAALAHGAAFRSVDGAVVGSFLEPLGQTKVMHSHRRQIINFFFFSIVLHMMYLEDRSNPALSLSFRPRQSRSTQGCVTMKIIVTYWKQKKKNISISLFHCTLYSLSIHLFKVRRKNTFR